MKLLWVLGCFLGVWVCHGLPQKDQVQKNQAKECVMYRTKNSAPPVMQFQRRISVAVMPQKRRSVTRLILQSTTTSSTCQLFFMAGSITPVCDQINAPSKNLEESDITELWMEVAGKTDDPVSAVWDLKVMARQGKHRTHILLSDTGLQPPVNMWVKSNHSIHYYFNCVTGCLFDKSMAMAPGDHTFFLRHDESFVQMTLDCGSHRYPMMNLRVNKTVPELAPPGDAKDLSLSMMIPFHGPNDAGLAPPGALMDVTYATKKLSINVTAAELGPAGGLKEVTIVWNKQLGNIGVVVDGAPLGNLTDYKPLTKERQVKVEVAEEGGGLVAPCNPHFQMVGCAGDEEVTEARNDPSTTTTSSETTHGPSADDASQQPQTSQQTSSRWLPAVFTFVVLNFIVTVAAVSLAVVLYRRSSSNNCQLTKDTSTTPAIFSKRFSTRSSTRSTQRGSQRRKAQGDATQGDKSGSCIGEENVNSETVTTPLTTPESLASPRKHRNLSTDEFVDLSLI